MSVSEADHSVAHLDRPFSAWVRCSARVPATAPIDLLVDHAEILSLKGDSYRPREMDLVHRQRRRIAGPPVRLALRASLRWRPYRIWGGTLSTGGNGALFDRP
jgi:hypothetical protein